MMSKSISIHYNDRNYSPPEWEAWKESQVIAHAQDLDLLTEKYPNAVVIEPKNEPANSYINNRRS